MLPGSEFENEGRVKCSPTNQDQTYNSNFAGLSVGVDKGAGALTAGFGAGGVGVAGVPKSRVAGFIGVLFVIPKALDNGAGF